WAKPHCVTFQDHNKFYSSGAKGKYLMDVAELRIAFNLSEMLTERIRRFREDRISKIFSNETPVPFDYAAKIVLHLIPLISFNPAQRYDIDKIASDPLKGLLPIYSSSHMSRYNLDGFLTYSSAVTPSDTQRTCSYVQLFRNGIIEAVEGDLLDPSYKGNKLEIPIEYEKELIESFDMYLNVLKLLEVEPPVLIFLALLGVKGYIMTVPQQHTGHYVSRRDPRATPIDRDVLLLPEVMIERYDLPAESILKPCFDSVANACGLPGSLNYDKAGKWVG
ncbi:MAG TPA: helix-turn-helix domain-containing protein, partial [Candidatus Hypogeohydataceae bacterium YC40]